MPFSPLSLLCQASYYSSSSFPRHLRQATGRLNSQSRAKSLIFLFHIFLLIYGSELMICLKSHPQFAGARSRGYPETPIDVAFVWGSMSEQLTAPPRMPDTLVSVWIAQEVRAPGLAAFSEDIIRPHILFVKLRVVKAHGEWQWDL